MEMGARRDTLILFNPFPYIETKNLALRQLSMNDDNEIFILRSDPEVQKYLDRPPAASVEDARAFIKKINTGIADNEWVYWAVCLSGSDKLCGTVCLWNFSLTENKAEIGYELLPSFQGRGIMQEAVDAVIKYAFNEIQLSSLDAILVPENMRSVKLLDKFRFIKQHKKSEYDSDNTITYTLTNPALKHQSE